MDDQYKTRQTLIQRLKVGQDEQSWEEFVRIYRPYIHAVIRNMNISEHDADDIAQQVMIRLWKHILKYSPNKRFRSWLSTITGNCVKDFVHKRKLDAERLEKAHRDATLTYLKAIRLPEIEQIAEREWGGYLTSMALKRVGRLFSGKAILVFKLSLEGHSVEEIARKVELKENSVYRLKNRVRERLAEEIEGLREELE